MKKKENVVIVGLGLIGGSVGLALQKKKRFHVFGISRTMVNLRRSIRKGAVQAGSTRPETILPLADWVVLAAPVSTITAWLEKCDRYCRPGTLVTDVSSIKGEINSWARKRKFKNIYFIGAHPMAGSHHSGIEHARAELFAAALTFVTRAAGDNKRAFERVRHFWQAISGRVRIISPEAHDRIVAEISHLPHALAALLVNSASPDSLSCAASGFRDTTRVAQGDPALWQEILLANRHMLVKGLRGYGQKLETLAKALESGNKSDVTHLLEKAYGIRRKMDKNPLQKPRKTR